MRPSPNPDSRALRDADMMSIKDGVYVIVADNGNRRAIHSYMRGILEARRIAATLTGRFPSIYCRLEGRWRPVH